MDFLNTLSGMSLDEKIPAPPMLLMPGKEYEHKKMFNVLEYYSQKNKYAIKNIERQKIALSKLRDEEVKAQTRRLQNIY